MLQLHRVGPTRSRVTWRSKRHQRAAKSLGVSEKRGILLPNMEATHLYGIVEEKARSLEKKKRHKGRFVSA